MDEAELPLDEAIEPEATAYRSRAKAGSDPGSSATASAPKRSGTGAAAAAPRRSKPASGSGSGSGSGTAQPSAAEVRALLAEKPARVAPGLSVARGEKGKPAGVGLDTEVGRIDLLAKDDDGALVVVTVAEDEKGKDLVADALQRIGWVRKHRAEVGQEVRGIVLLAEVPDDLVYAAAAVGDTLSFRIYRMSIAFDDVQL